MSTNLSRWCFPKSTIRFVQEVERPRGARKTKLVLTISNEKKPAQACVMIFTPSEWAKLDVETYTFYADVYEHPQRNSP